MAKDLDNNILLVAQGSDHPALFHTHLRASQLHWVSGQPPQTPFACSAKVRYRQADQDCEISALDNDQCIVKFNQAQRAITPGQSVVFYRQDECLGGGVIDAMYNE